MLKQGVSNYDDEYVFLLTANGKAINARALGKANLFESVKDWVSNMRPKPTLLKGAYDPSKDTDLLGTLFALYKLEKRRAIYQIKPDLCSGSFPASVLQSAFTDNCDMGEDDMAKARARLKPIIEARLRNAREKTQPSYFVCSPAETKRFLDCGVLTDQPRGLRPFTREERREIVDSLLERAKISPHYHFHFLRDDMRIGQFQFIAYEGVGVMAMLRNTDYQAGRGSDDLFVSEPMFLKQYISYYTQTLLERRAYPEAESLKMLAEMREKI